MFHTLHNHTIAILTIIKATLCCDFFASNKPSLFPPSHTERNSIAQQLVTVSKCQLHRVTHPQYYTHSSQSIYTPPPTTHGSSWLAKTSSAQNMSSCADTWCMYITTSSNLTKNTPEFFVKIHKKITKQKKRIFERTFYNFWKFGKSAKKIHRSLVEVFGQNSFCPNTSKNSSIRLFPPGWKKNP